MINLPPLYIQWTFIGALSEIRTQTLRLLRPLSLPIGVRGQLFFSVFYILVRVENFEISTLWLKARYSASELHPHTTICFADALFAKSQRNWWPHYRLSTELLKVDVYLMAYISKTNGIPYEDRTRLRKLKAY